MWMECFVFNNIINKYIKFYTRKKNLMIKVKLPVHTIKSNEEEQSLLKKVEKNKQEQLSS